MEEDRIGTGFYLVQLTMRQAATQNPFIFPGQSQHWSTKFRIDKSRHIRCLKIEKKRNPMVFDIAVKLILHHVFHFL